MSKLDISNLHEYVLSIKSLLYNLFDETDKALTEAKLTKKGKELDCFFDDYRKDKFLKECFLIFLNDIVKNIKSNSDFKNLRNYTKLVLLLSSLVDQHKTVVCMNKLGNSNAMKHFSTRGIMLVNSPEFFELHNIYEKLYGDFSRMVQ